MKDLIKVQTAKLEDLTFSQRFAVKIILLVFGRFINIENDGFAADTSGSVIFAFNHNNAIETVLLAAYLLYARNGAKVHFVVDWVFGYIPVVGSVVRLVEPVFVFNKKPRFKWLTGNHRRPPNAKAWDECVDRLRQQGSIAIFPEGTRNHDPQVLLAGRAGVGRIVLSSAAPVVPVGIAFCGQNRSGRVPVLGSVVFRFGERLNFTTEIDESRAIRDSGELSDRDKRRRLAYLDKMVVHKVMTEISRLSGKSYPFEPPALPQAAAS